MSGHFFCWVWHWLTIFGTLVYHHDTMCRVHWWSWFNLELWPQGQTYRVIEMFLCPAHNYYLIWHWLIIFGTWVYHHENMWQVHSYSGFDVDIWSHGLKAYRLLLCVLARLLTAVSFDSGLPYLTHGSITMTGCVKYIHDHGTMLTFDLKGVSP